MKIDRSLLTGSTTMLLLTLLEQRDMYGYEMIEELASQSNHVFSLKAGTLYPLLHDLEVKGILSSYDSTPQGARPRKYYHLTKNGKTLLAEKQTEWTLFSSAIAQVLKGGVHCEQT